MPRHLYVVTGASRGLGRAIAEQLLAPDHQVLGISRQAPPASAGLEQWACDLAEPGPVAERLRQWLRTFDAAGYASATLINNAAILPAPSPLRDAEPAIIPTAVRVGLEAPLLLTAAFLDATRGWRVPKRVLHISSGLGRRAMTGAAIYCAIKAGIDHLARAQALEEQELGTGVRITSLGPGVIDTDMQAQLRAADPVGFPERDTWVRAKQQGNLDTPETAAQKILSYLHRSDFGSEAVTDLRTLFPG